ncbi:hypothetical protein LJK88_01780 [Paenibacillus sp. P26]|nr:hypothetical protein LJK88_01780 [Paenibacillus sp. P26]UUZ91066.1 hypothetical protein LJK87_35690 [Paenibacillus sp. P25]
MFLSKCLIGVILLLLILILSPKRMHLFEFLFNGMIVIYLYTYLFSILSNMKLVEVSTEMDKALSSILVRMVMNPIIVLLFLQLYLSLRSFSAKTVLTLAFSILLAALQYASKWAGLIEQSDGVTKGSALLWFMILLLCLTAMKGFRRIIRKEELSP